MKSANEIGPSRRMRSRKRSARSGGTGLALYFRSEDPSAPGLRARGPRDSPFDPVRVAQATSPDARGLLRPRFDVDGALPRRLEERRRGRDALLHRLPLARSAARRSARGGAVAAAVVHSDLTRPGPRDTDRKRGRPPAPTPGDPLAVRDAGPLRERSLRLPAPGREARG